MAENSKIQWTDHTVNFWTGCLKVSDGCKYCYMYRDQERYGKEPTTVLRVQQKTINRILKTAKSGDKIFTCSWSDFFIEEADQWRDWAWDIIKNNPDKIWQILTKRPERIEMNLPKDWGETGYPNVWLGVSVESSKYVERVRILNKLKTAKSKFKTFVSYEPAIGELIFTPYFLNTDWLIVGGESGNDTGKYRYRECQFSWITDIVRQCMYYKIPVFVKQMGTYLANELKLKDRHGGNMDEFVLFLQKREFPK